jgi:hypothetical protein
MTADKFRQMALGIAGAVESAHMNHPDFRLNDRIFASLGAPDDDWGMVKLTPAQQRAFIRKSSKIFRPCSGAWGRQGCTNVHLESAREAILSSALEAAAKNVASRAAKRKRSGSKSTP